MATARSTRRERVASDRSEAETVAWRRPMKTRSPRSRLSSRSTSSRAPLRTPTDREARWAVTASAASAPAFRAAETRSGRKSAAASRGEVMPRYGRTAPEAQPPSGQGGEDQQPRGGEEGQIGQDHAD